MPRLVLMIIHNGDARAVQTLMDLHKNTRIITLSPHVHKFLAQRFRLEPRNSRLLASVGAWVDAWKAHVSTPQRTEHPRKLQQAQNGNDHTDIPEIVQQQRASVIDPRIRKFAFNVADVAGDPSSAHEGRSTHFLREHADPSSLLAVAERDSDFQVSVDHTAPEPPSTFTSLIKRFVPRFLIEMIKKGDQPLTRDQLVMLQRGTWMLPTVDWSPKKPCEQLVLGTCFDGFAIQVGQLNALQVRCDVTFVCTCLPFFF